MSEKTPNYTETQVSTLVAAYTAETVTNDAERAAVVATTAVEFAKSPASIRAKLVREGVYVKKTYKTKAGGESVSKAVMVERVASAMGVASDTIGSLEKATKTTIAAVLKAVTPAEVVAETEESEAE
jgi:hypothetical protein